MAKTISLSVPHNLTQEEARARIQKGIQDLRAQFGSRVSDVQENWTDNHLDFSLRAVGQPISGRVDVLPRDVKFEVDLPWMLAMFAGKLVSQAEQETRRLLESK